MTTKVAVAFFTACGAMCAVCAKSYYMKPGSSNWAGYDSYYNNDGMDEGSKTLPDDGDVVMVSGGVGSSKTLYLDTSDLDSLAIVNRLSKIVPQHDGSKIEIYVPSEEVSLLPAITRFGSEKAFLIVKKGAGTLVLSNSSLCSSGNASLLYSYLADFDVQEGILKLPQGLSAKSIYCDNVHVSGNAALWLMSLAEVSGNAFGYNTFSSLTGSGLVTNVAPLSSPRYLKLKNGGVFGGIIGGGIILDLCGEETRFDFTGMDSTFSGLGEGLRLSESGLTLGLRSFTADDPLVGSSMGRNALLRTYAPDARIVYLGDGGEATTVGLNVLKSPITIDAGAKGGITFENGGEWTGYYGSRTTPSLMQHLVLDGSNTEVCVFRPRLKCWKDNIAEDANRTNFTWYITKKGAGTWFFDYNPYSSWEGGFCVMDGTVKFDMFPEVGVNGPFGTAINAQVPYCGAWSQESNVAYSVAFGGEAGSPRFEYVGSNIVNNTTRHIGLNTKGTLVNSGPHRFLLTGVMAANSGEKELILDGTNKVLNTVRDIEDGSYGGRVGITKRGTGNWMLDGNIAFSGPLRVEEGALYINNATHYRWFKFTPTMTYWEKSGASNNYSVQLAEFALYDKGGNRVNVGMKGPLWPASQNDDNDPVGLTTDYTALVPGTATQGRYDYMYDYSPLTYDRGSRDSAGAITAYNLDGFTSLFDDTPAYDSRDTYFVCNRTKILQERPKTWVSLFMHVANTVEAVASYDWVIYSGGQGPMPISWQMHASVNGLDWDLVDEKVEVIPANNTNDSFNYWSCTGASGVASRHVRGQIRHGYPISMSPAGNPPTVALENATVSVLSGARLVADGGITISKLDVDFNDAGTIDGFTFAPTGTLRIKNLPVGHRHVLPASFVNSRGLRNLQNWGLMVDGGHGDFRLKVSGDRLVALRIAGLVVHCR